jgi:hypothetical protein
LLLSDGAAEDYEASIQDFLVQVRGAVQTEALRMKPLDRDTVVAELIDTGAKTSGPPKTYPVGKPLVEHLTLRFRSRFEHLAIREGQVTPVTSEAVFQPGSLVEPAQRAIDITPTKIEDLQAGAQSEQTYAVDIDLGPVRLKRDLASVWKAAFGSSGENAVLDLAFRIDVPQENFVLKQSFLSTYHASSLEEARQTGKVYAVNQLPGLVGGAATAIRVECPVTFRVTYPWWPALVFLFGGAVLLALLGAAIYFLAPRVKRLFHRERKWVVTAAGADQQPVPASVGNEGAVLVRGEPAGKIEKDKFTPDSGAGVALENGEESLALFEDAQAPIRIGGEAVTLSFTTGSERRKKPTETPRELTER